MTIRTFRTLEKLITLLPQLPEDVRRHLVEVLCESGLKMISSLVEEVGEPRHPVDVAVAMTDVALRAGHPEVLDKALAKVDVTWPTEIVVAFWAATAIAAEHLPGRKEMWERFEARALPRH